MKVAITAASGNLGSEIVKATVALIGKQNVIGLARTPAKVQHLGVQVLAGDYNKQDELEKSLQGVDTVLLVSGMDAPDKRIEQHRNVINAAKSAGVKKFVYTSVQGADEGTAFSAVVQSNRQTEEDVKTSGLDWSIGRNGIYIEPDIEYIETYKKHGGIVNCAGEGKCGYAIRSELAYAYAKMLTEEKHNGKTYNLHGESISQQQLANYMNQAYGTELTYTSISVDDYRTDRIAELGDFLGAVITGIYEGILQGKYDNPSDYETAAGREHASWHKYFSSIH